MSGEELSLELLLDEDLFLSDDDDELDGERVSLPASARRCLFRSVSRELESALDDGDDDGVCVVLDCDELVDCDGVLDELSAGGAAV